LKLERTAMSAGPSLQSLAASGLYACVLLACFAAAVTAQRKQQLPGHFWTWFVLGIFFGGLVALRVVGLEETVRSGLRASLQTEGSYDERRSIQGPIVASLVMLSGVCGLFLLYRINRHLRGRRNFVRVAAIAAACAMLVLITLRVTSLHAIDALLYGPLKLNWVIDIGASLTVLFGAIFYIRLVLRNP
jgi:hypothetical protein